MKILYKLWNSFQCGILRTGCLILFLVWTESANAQMYVKGRCLYTQAGEQVILKGPNEFFWPLSDLYSAAHTEIAEMAKTGANCVRIGWLDAANRPLDALDSLINNCIRNKMIPVVTCHDATTPDWAKLNTALGFWAKPAVISLIEKYKKWVVINIANEEGTYTAPSTDYKTNYSNAVLQLRNEGYDIPFIIDASDYGQNEVSIYDNWAAINNADPKHDLLFSLHTYWQTNAGGDVNQRFVNFVNAAVSGSIPVVIGEGIQPAGFNCSPDWDYIKAISLLQSNQIGFMPWSWGLAKNGNCPSYFNATTNGSYGSWTNDWARLIFVDDANSIQKTAIRPASIGGTGGILFSVNLTAPLAYATATTGTDLLLAATAYEGGTAISKVEYYQGSVKIGEVAAPPFTFTWHNVPTGNYLLTARATDVNGLSSNSTSTPISVYPATNFSGLVKFVSKGSAKVLDNPGGTSKNLTQLIQDKDNGNASQLWSLAGPASGFYTMTNKAGGTCMDLYGGSTANGAVIQIYDCTGAPQQQWAITQVDPGYYIITNKASSKALEVSSSSIADSVKIDQADYTGADNQKWQVVSASGTGTVSVTGVSLSPSTLNLNVGASGQLSASIQPANASNTGLSFSSDNAQVAAVNTQGLVTAVAAGTAHITVTTNDGAKTAVSTVIVQATSTANSAAIYDDALENNWTVSGGSKYDLTQSLIVKDGTKAIAITFPGSWYTVEFNSATPFNTGSNTSFSFYGYGGSNTTKVQVIFLNATGSETGRKALTLSPGVWTLNTISLSDVGSPAQISKVIFQDGSGGPQPVFYLDDIGFSGGTVQADKTPPSDPPNQRASSITSNSLSLQWDAASDNVGVTGYNIYENGTFIATVTSGLSYNITGLSPATQYTFLVKAFDATGNFSYGPGISVTTPALNTGTYFIYDDQVENGWTAGGGASYNLANTSVVKNGKAAIAVTFPGAYYTLEFSPGSSFSTSTFSSFSFWGYGGTGGTRVQAIFIKPGGTEAGRKQFILTASQWQHYAFNLSDIGDIPQVGRIIFQDYSGNAQPTFYLDDIQFSNQAASAAIAKAALAKNQTTPSLTVFPNPAKNQFTAQFQVKSNQTVSISISNITGKTVLLNSFHTLTGLNKFMLYFNLRDGVYIVQVFHDGSSESKNLIVSGN